MDSEEYNEKKREIDYEVEGISAKQVREAPTKDSLTPEEIDRMVEQSRTIMSEEEKEKILREEEHDLQLEEFGGTNLTNIPELSDFLRSEEHIRLGTNARIPIPLEVEGHPVKVFIRPLSRKELIKCRNKANAKGHNDVDYEAVKMVCTDSEGRPYTEQQLNMLGYGHIQTIAEAIIIASGESPENTQTALRRRLVDEFLEKFTSEASREVE